MDNVTSLLRKWTTEIVVRESFWFIIRFFFFSVLGIKFQALSMLGKCSTSELHPSPLKFFSNFETVLLNCSGCPWTPWVAQAASHFESSCLNLQSSWDCRCVLSQQFISNSHPFSRAPEFFGPSSHQIWHKQNYIASGLAWNLFCNCRCPCFWMEKKHSSGNWFDKLY